MLATGAVVAGAGTFEPAGGWGGDHHDGVPIFIYSRHAPPFDITRWPLVTYVGDVETAMTRAKEAAGEKDVLVHGAAVTQLALAAGVLDEMELHVVPVLLGQGRHLFDHLDSQHIELERVRTFEGEHGVTHLRYRVRHLALPTLLLSVNSMSHPLNHVRRLSTHAVRVFDSGGLSQGPAGRRLHVEPP